MSKMTLETLEDQIKKRADVLVQAQIKACKVEVYNAVNKLLGTGPLNINSQIDANYASSSWRKDLHTILECLASENNTKGWPTSIWQTQRESLTNEVMGRMDELQRILLAAEVDAADRVAEPAEEAKVEQP